MSTCYQGTDTYLPPVLLCRWLPLARRYLYKEARERLCPCDYIRDFQVPVTRVDLAGIKADLIAGLGSLVHWQGARHYVEVT